MEIILVGLLLVGIVLLVVAQGVLVTLSVALPLIAPIFLSINVLLLLLTIALIFLLCLFLKKDIERGFPYLISRGKGKTQRWGVAWVGVCLSVIALG
ncbi:hypothetical protein L1887_07628 [Cichorium endivia]|nr:hypothetical protein L1887_07628 [Cichorium endivia]